MASQVGDRMDMVHDFEVFTLKSRARVGHWTSWSLCPPASWAVRSSLRSQLPQSVNDMVRDQLAEVGEDLEEDREHGSPARRSCPHSPWSRHSGWTGARSHRHIGRGTHWGCRSMRPGEECQVYFHDQGRLRNNFQV